MHKSKVFFSPAVASLLLLLLFLLHSVFIAGCTKKVPAMAPLPFDATVLAFGNSLTFGTGATADTSYPTYLAALTGFKVINAGIPGEVSEQGLARLPGLLQQHQPDLLILGHGGNDMLRRLGLETMEHNLARMIQLALERDVQVVLLGIPAPAVLKLSTADVYLDLAQRFAIPIEDRSIPYVLSRNEFKADPIHPNAAGYKVMAQHIHELLSKAGAL